MSDREPMRVTRADRLWNLYWFGPERLLLRVEQYWRHYWVLVALYLVISFPFSFSGELFLSLVVPLCALILPLMLHINAEQQKIIREADEWYDRLLDFKDQVDASRQNLTNLGISAQQASQSLNQMASLVNQSAGPKSGSVQCPCDACDDVRNRYNDGGPVA